MKTQTDDLRVFSAWEAFEAEEARQDRLERIGIVAAIALTLIGWAAWYHYFAPDDFLFASNWECFDAPSIHGEPKSQVCYYKVHGETQSVQIRQNGKVVQ